jgi:hypothetical protein
VSVAALDEDVLAQLRERVLTPERIERVVQRAIELHTASPGDTEAQQHTLRAEVRGLDRELAEFTRAVAAGASDIPALVAAMRSGDGTRPLPGWSTWTASPGRPRIGAGGAWPASCKRASASGSTSSWGSPSKGGRSCGASSWAAWS